MPCIPSFFPEGAKDKGTEGEGKETAGKPGEVPGVLRGRPAATSAEAVLGAAAGGLAGGQGGMWGGGHALQLGAHGHGEATHLPHVHLGREVVHGEGRAVWAEGHPLHALLPRPGLHEAVRPRGHGHAEGCHGVAAWIYLHPLHALHALHPNTSHLGTCRCLAKPLSLCETGETRT